MGLACATCLTILVNENEKKKNEEMQKQYSEMIKKSKEEQKIREAKLKEETIKKIEEEIKRKDLKVLDNIEKLNLNKNEFYKPLPPNKNLKFFFEKSPFMDGPKETIIEMKVLKGLANYVIKFDESKYGIVYYSKYCDKRFVDIYECSKQTFLYRITDINGDNIKYIKQLIDGTHYIDTINRHYVVKIIKDLGYQVLYEIEMKGSLFFFHDEKILSDEIQEKNSILSLFEKDNNGIYKKTKEKLIEYALYEFIQVRDNIMASKNMNYIFFYEIDTLNLIKRIDYLSRNNILVLLNDTFLLVNSISGSINRFNLIHIDTMEIIKYLTEDEDREDYKGSYVIDDMVDSYKLPNGFVLIRMLTYGLFRSFFIIVHWDEEKNIISFKSNLDIRQLPNQDDIDSFLAFKEYNLLIVNIGNKHYLYFKN